MIGDSDFLDKRLNRQCESFKQFPDFYPNQNRKNI